MFILKVSSVSPSNEMEYSVTLYRGNEKSFGLTYDHQNVVTGIVSGGPAHSTGKIRIDDRIHAINGSVSTNGSETYSLLISCATTVNMVLKRKQGKWISPTINRNLKEDKRISPDVVVQYFYICVSDLMTFEMPEKNIYNHKSTESLIDILDKEDPKYQIKNLDNIEKILKSKKGDCIPDGLPAFLYSFVDKAKKLAFPAVMLCNTTNEAILSSDIPLIEALNASIGLGEKMIEVFQTIIINRKTSNWDLEAKLVGVNGILTTMAEDVSMLQTTLNQIDTTSQSFQNQRVEYDKDYKKLDNYMKRNSYTKAHNHLQNLEEEDMYFDYEAFMHGLKERKKEESVLEYQALLILRQKIEIMKQLKCFFKDIEESGTENLKYYCSKDGRKYLEFLEDQWSYMKTQGLDEVGGWKIPTVLVLGKTGTGKSSLCNVFAGKMAGSTKISGGFPVSAAQDSCTQETTAGDFSFYGNILRPVTLIDTPGFDDPKKHHDATIISGLVDKLKGMKEVHQILIAVNGTNPRLDGSMKAMIDIFQRMFTKDIWENIGIVFTKLSMDKSSIRKRNKNWEVTDQEFADGYVDEIKKEFSIEDKERLETYFIDACYDKDDPDEVTFFDQEMDSLWRAIHQKKKFDTNRVEKVMTEFDSLQEELKRQKQEMTEQRMTIKALEEREWIRLEQDKEEARKPEHGYTWCTLKTGQCYETTIDNYVDYICKMSPESNHFSDQNYFDEGYWKRVLDKWTNEPNGFQQLNVKEGNQGELGASLSFSLNINNTTKYYLRGEKNYKGLGRVPDDPAFLWYSDFDENIKITRLTNFSSFVVPPFTKERITFFNSHFLTSTAFFGSLKAVLTFTVSSDHFSDECLEHIMLMFKVKGKGKNSLAVGFPNQVIMDNSEVERIFKNKQANNDYYSKDFMSRRKALNKHVQGSQIFWPPEKSQQSGGFHVTFSIGNHQNCIGSFTLKKTRECNVEEETKPEMYRDLL